MDMGTTRTQVKEKGTNIPKTEYSRKDYWNCSVMVNQYCISKAHADLLPYLSSEPTEISTLALAAFASAAKLRTYR